MTVNKLYLEINCEFNDSSIVLNQIPLFVRETFFQKNRHKTVGGVAHTRYPVSINFDSKNARKMPKLK